MQTVSRFIHEYYIDHQEDLSQKYPGIKESRLLDEFLSVTNLKAKEIYLNQAGSFFEKLEQGVPLEYISQNAFFYRYNFFVNDSVLIPRSETEILVEDSISFIKKTYHSQMKVAEVGIGSFCIGLSLLLEINRPLFLWAGDISNEALEVAKINTYRHRSRLHHECKIEFSLSDRLNKTEEKFDLIVSNPPYINQEMFGDKVHGQTHLFEPHVALYLKNDEYTEWFDAFFQDCCNKLRPLGAFFMEGHEDELEKLASLADKYFNKVELKRDYTGSLRFLYCYR